jgi:hypothetical protein
MATKSATDQLSPLEVAKRQGNGEIQKIVEAMSETNEILFDAPILEASDGVVQNTTVRTTVPAGTRRLYNQDITAHASETKLVQDYIEMLEDYSDVDADMADHAPNRAELLQSETEAFLQGLGLTQADDYIYGNRGADPAQINGLHIRYPGLSSNSVIAPASAASSNGTSLWLVKWSPNLVHLMYPRGRSADLGIKREFRGKVDSVGSSGKHPVYSTFFSTHFGLVVKDPRAVKRIANIKTDGTADGEDLVKKILWLKNFLPAGAGTICLYGNSIIKGAIEQYLVTKSNMAYTAEDPWGREVTKVFDMRLRRVDAILNTETILT